MAKRRTEERQIFGVFTNHARGSYVAHRIEEDHHIKCNVYQPEEPNGKVRVSSKRLLSNDTPCVIAAHDFVTRYVIRNGT
ncbi:hypothetical protein LCGC14_2831830 [marine sediment metagenome]|uniref:Uncharacterized protein n=1 Tax=marine sediment metagenome TaxID=412755 RepID=A0A0F8YDU9_9ZZZZ